VRQDAPPKRASIRLGIVIVIVGADESDRARNGCTQREQLGAAFSASHATLRRDAARIAREDPCLTRYLLEFLLTCPGCGPGRKPDPLCRTVV